MISILCIIFLHTNYNSIIFSSGLTNHLHIHISYYYSYNTMKTIPRYLIAWLGLLFIAIINGAIRETVYKNALGELSAHQVSTVTGIILMTFYVWFINIRWKLQSAKQALTIGFIWLTLTIAFEFLFGHYIMGNPWGKLFHDYNIVEGRVWILFLIWITIVPYLIYKWKASSATNGGQST